MSLESPIFITIIGFVILFVAAAIAGNTFEVLHPAMISEFGWGTGPTSVGRSISLITAVGGLYFVGAALNRFGIRDVIMAGIALMMLSLATLSHASRLKVFWSAMGLMGLSSALATVAPVQTLIGGWFPHRSQRIMSFVFLGQHFGGATMTLVASVVLKSRGWRAFCKALGVPLALLMVLVCFVHNPPRVVEAGCAYRSSWGSLLFPQKFWLLGVNSLLAGLGSGAFTHLVRVAESVGLQRTQGKQALAILHGATVVATLLVGCTAGRLTKNSLMGLMYVLGVAGVILLVRSRSAASLYISAGFLGIPDGAFPLWTALITDRYASGDLARLFGFQGALFLLGRAASVALIGYSFHKHMTYNRGLLGAGGFLLAASLLIALCR